MDIYISLPRQDRLHQFVELPRLNSLVWGCRYHVGGRNGSRDRARGSRGASRMTCAIAEEHLNAAVDVFLREVYMGCRGSSGQSGESEGESYRVGGLVDSRTKRALTGSEFGRDFVKPFQGSSDLPAPARGESATGHKHEHRQTS